ncbi:MAG: flagellar hook-length control protein FliK [Treponema sp.]|nr:flagellar hook-length control protein FliK [Treponema sp.]
MIAITAYTEPALALVVNEPQQTHENEENEESSSFAELLAGLLQKTQSENVAVSEIELDAESVDKDAIMQNLFINEIEDGVDLESSELELSQEYQDILLSAEHLFNSSLETEVPVEDQDALSPDYLAERKQSRLNELAQKEQSPITEKADTNSAELYAASEAAAKKSAEEALSTTADKRKRASSEAQSLADSLSKREDAHALSAKNKLGEENSALLNKKQEAPGKLEELRNRRRDRVSFEVRDLRTDNTKVSNGAEMRTVSLDVSGGRVQGQLPVQEMTLDLRMSDQGQSSAQTTWETKASSALENMLARELHQNFNGDIVRHASMILRDGGSGIIKIALHPETLGNVKIRLEMTENKITGHIFVDSQEALNAFRKEIASLEQAFKNSGFEDANLNLSLTADGFGEQQEQELDERFLDQRLAASNYENSFEQETAPIIDVFFGRNTGSVNMFA